MRASLLLFLAACSSSGTPAVTTADAPVAPALRVHVVNRFEGCLDAYLTVTFPPALPPATEHVACPDVGHDIDYVVPYPAGTATGEGNIQFEGERGAPGAALGYAEFTIADVHADTHVDVPVCWFAIPDGGVPFGCPPPDAG